MNWILPCCIQKRKTEETQKLLHSIPTERPINYFTYDSNKFKALIDEMDKNFLPIHTVAVSESVPQASVSGQAAGLPQVSTLAQTIESTSEVPRQATMESRSKVLTPNGSIERETLRSLKSVKLDLLVDWKDS